MYVYGSLWFPVCNFDLLMNILNIHLCFKDIRMFNYRVERHIHCLLLLQPTSRFVPYNSLFVMVALSSHYVLAVAYSRFAAV